MKYHLESMFPKLNDDGESIDIQFKRLIPMDKSLAVDIDDLQFSSCDSVSGTQCFVNSKDSPDSDENETNEPTDLDLELQDMFRSDESETVDNESDPLRMDSQSNDELDEQSQTDNPKPLTVDSESNGESEGKQMRLDETECNHVNSSERPDSSCSCESIFSQATVDFEFDKQNNTDETAAAVEQPVLTDPNHDVVHSTQLTPSPNVPTGTVGLDLPIRAYIEALERLKDELWSQNMKYEEQLEIMQKENRTLREENLRLTKNK